MIYYFQINKLNDVPIEKQYVERELICRSFAYYIRDFFLKLGYHIPAGVSFRNPNVFYYVNTNTKKIDFFWSRRKELNSTEIFNLNDVLLVKTQYSIF